MSDPAPLTMQQIERAAIEQRLKHFNGNKTQAALSLGISLKTIYNKLNAYRRMDAQGSVRS